MRSVLQLLYTLEAAGAEKVVLSIVDRLDRRQFAPVVCAFRGGGLKDSFERLGIPVYVLNKRSGPDPRVLWQLVRVMLRHRVAVVHSHNFSANLWGRVAALLARVPVRIATEHSMPTIKSRLECQIDRSLAPLTTKIVSVSTAVRDAHVRDEGIAPERFEVIYNGIDEWTSPEDERRAFAADLRARHGIPAGAPICVTVGRLEPPKGHVTLLAAIPSILANAPGVRFLLVGDGSLRRTLEAQARALGIEAHVVFLGARDDARRILAVSDIAISPSDREGFSMAVLEAMAAGCTPVVTDVGGNAEAVQHEHSGLVVPAGDPPALAEAVGRVLADPAWARAMAAAARQRFQERFTIEKMIRSHEALYAAGAN